MMGNDNGGMVHKTRGRRSEGGVELIDPWIAHTERDR